MSKVVLRNFKYRLYPNKEQEKMLQWVLDRCRELYNAALQERKDAYRMCGKSISYYDQDKQLSEIREIRPEYLDIPYNILRDPLQRVHRTFQDFYRRCKMGKKSGRPRFKGRNRYNSFTYPQNRDFKLNGTRIKLTKIGDIKIRLHRPIEGKIKTLTIKRESEQWYAMFVCEVDVEELPASYEDVGIDLGITHFAALSNGEFIDNPRYYRKGEKTLERRRQALCRKKKGSHRREKAKRLVAKAHRKVRNQRKDFLHKGSRRLVDRYQMIVFEDLQTASMVKRPKPIQDESGKYLHNGASQKAGLNKSIYDAGWGMFIQMCIVKAECAGRCTLKVDPYKTSQICSGCHQEGSHKGLEERTHICIHCGLVLDRDTNAAINILEAGRVLQSAMAVKAS